MEAMERTGNVEMNSGVNEDLQNILLTRVADNLHVPVVGDPPLSRTQKAVSMIPKGLWR
jgi:hypothetical protein